MRLELIMLTTAISVITDRQVEAQLKCFENRNGTGKSVTFSASSRNIASQFPKGPKACNFSPNTVYIFYSETYHTGHVNLIFDKNGGVYRPRSRFIPKSILMITNPDGVHLFLRKNYQGGSPMSFSMDNSSVTDGTPFLSAVAVGSVDWTIETDCNNKPCLTCLKADNQGGASFFQDIKIGVLDDVISVSRANCTGKSYTGKSRVPDCPCNQLGVVDGPDKCEGTNGICQCLSNHTGDDCDLCKDKFVWREGKCVAGCGCYLPGTQGNGKTCNWGVRWGIPPGHCECDWGYYTGEKCDECPGWFYTNYDGQCLSPGCTIANTIRPAFPDYDGHCNCKPKYRGKCDTCNKGLFAYKTKCLDQPQYDEVQALKDMHDNDPTNKTKFYIIVHNLVRTGVLRSNKAQEGIDNVKNDWRTAKYQANYFLKYEKNWRA